MRDSGAKLHLPVLDARPQRPYRGESIGQWIERPFALLDRLLAHLVPERHNPINQAGAIGNLTFFIAILSGVVLLIWYVPSVHQAHASLESLRSSPWTGELTRSVHRYSSDACMFFVLVHALRYFATGRFTGPRWLAWVTGLLGVALLWFVGWIGYWLVWDESGKAVALSTAKVLDTLPIFADPLTRSFLTDEGLNSLLFFVVFFFHMLIPLAGAVVLWLHITRLSRAKFIPTLPVTLWVCVSLIALSLILPATSGSAARMLESHAAYSIDAWYLFPVAIAERLHAGALWALLLVGGVVLYSVPWVLRRGRARVAVVEPSRCNSCNTCAIDCPYDAIRMVNRSDGRPFAQVAEVDPAKCAGCGVCAGSCDSSGIGLPWIPAPEVRHNMDAFLERQLESSPTAAVAFLCAQSAGAGLRIDPASGRCENLPGYLCWPVPCAGWIHPLTIERAFRHGASGVLVVACGPGSCAFREGALFTENRIDGTRSPKLREDHVDPSRVAVVRVDRWNKRALTTAAAAFIAGRRPAKKTHSGTRAFVAGVALSLASSAVTGAASTLSYSSRDATGPELVVSFKHAGERDMHCHRLSEAEKARLPLHMRRDEVCERGRGDIRLRVLVDGQLVHARSYPPRGLFGDGSSVALVRLPITEGQHHVNVSIGVAADANTWKFESDHALQFGRRERHVVLFDRGTGFVWR